MIKLYGGAYTRAPIVQWYLEELNQPYEYVELDLRGGENRSERFLAINPFGKLPALSDGDITLYESGAILLYLSEKHANLPMPEKALVMQWVVFANATLGPGLFIQENRDKEMPKLLPHLEDLFGQKAYLVGDRLTVADVAVACYLAYLPMFIGLDFNQDYPNMGTYVKRLAERPAFQNTMGKCVTL
jgi:glutathione S-transferase